MQVEGQHGNSLLFWVATGARVSNTYATCPLQGDNRGKLRLIPYIIMILHDIMMKDLDMNKQVVQVLLETK